jgi:hypothetical protein
LWESESTAMPSVFRLSAIAALTVLMPAVTARAPTPIYRVTYPAGWNLIGISAGPVTGTDAPLYTLQPGGILTLTPFGRLPSSG